jgi:hypothetical protein
VGNGLCAVVKNFKVRESGTTMTTKRILVVIRHEYRDMPEGNVTLPRLRGSVTEAHVYVVRSNDQSRKRLDNMICDLDSCPSYCTGSVGK